MGDRFALGLNVAMLLVVLKETVPCTPATMKVEVLIVGACIPSLKVALILLLRKTFVDLFAGLVDITVGGVVSLTAAVVNDQVWFAAKWLPDVSATPVVTVTE